MSRANRRDIFDPNEVGVYHCSHRTVRRAFLCGWDVLTQRNFDHRKQWIEDRLITLSSIFAFDMLSYAVMDNHFHLVTRNRPDVLNTWSDQEVLNRWWQLCPIRRQADGSPAIATEADLAQLLAEQQSESTFRERLGSISWMMRYLAEPIARQANQEDDCTGHFWEGRFKSQRLLDEAGLLACCAYVDLNPIRAGIVDLPEKYRHTSIFKRISAQIEEAALLSRSSSPGYCCPRSLIFHTRVAAKKLVRWILQNAMGSKLNSIANKLQTILSYDVELKQRQSWITEVPKHHKRSQWDRQPRKWKKLRWLRRRFTATLLQWLWEPKPRVSL